MTNMKSNMYVIQELHTFLHSLQVKLVISLESSFFVINIFTTFFD